MKRFVCPTPVPNPNYTRMDYCFQQSPDRVDTFVQAAAQCFVENWMKSALPAILHVWQSWDTSSEEDRSEYLSYLYHLFTKGKLIDDPKNGYTNPIGTFAETMLRWLKQSFSPTPLLMEPATPEPAGNGDVDFVEIMGVLGDYSSMSVTMWEVKSSDDQVGAQSGKVYRQLHEYPARFSYIANHMATTYAHENIDPELKRFLRDMNRIVRNHRAQAHYGVFMVHDANIVQKVPLVPDLHRYPERYPSSQDSHSCLVLLVPDFKAMRLKIWHALHLIEE